MALASAASLFMKANMLSIGVQTTTRVPSFAMRKQARDSVSELENTSPDAMAKKLGDKADTNS